MVLVLPVNAASVVEIVLSFALNALFGIADGVERDFPWETTGWT
jgi:hypothetical protein